MSNKAASPNIKVVIPALNEEKAIAKVISEISMPVSEIIVADNGSTDQTARVARHMGATVVSVEQAGYGLACLAGIAAANPCDIIVFMDGDASDFPEDMEKLISPILNNDVDFVVGSRIHDGIETGALTPQQRFGNTLACWLMKRIWKSRFTDLGPFRAIKYDKLLALNMTAPTFGWTVEMQIRALKHKLRYTEIPVRYRKRIGKSKISGTLSGVILAGIYILGTIGREVMIKND